MKTVARIVSIIFHPLVMPVLGLLLILNSGTYLSLLDPSIKRALLAVMALGTLVFPMMLIPALFYRRSNLSLYNLARSERIIPLVAVLMLNGVTFLYFYRLHLNDIIHGFALSSVILVFLILVSNSWIKMCAHTAALGGMVALILMLIFLYSTPLAGILILAILASGIMGSSRLILGIQKPAEVYSGFGTGFGVVALTLLSVALF